MASPRIVVVGGVTSTSAPAIVTSDDAVTWTAQTPDTTPVSAFLISVTHGGDKFIASNTRSDGGNNTQHSPDGVNWSLFSSGSSKRVAVYGGGQFVSVTAASSSSFTSPDGLTWTTHSGGGLPNSTWNDIAYGNGVYVAVGSTNGGHTIASSPDGITWTTYATTTGWADVAFGNGLFVAVLGGASGFMPGTAADYTITSPDGINWTLRNSWRAQWKDVAFGGGQFLALGVAFVSPSNYAVKMTSPDGITWTYSDSGTIPFSEDLAYGAGVFIAPTFAGDIMTSADAASWSTAPFADRSWRGVDVGPPKNRGPRLGLYR